MFLKKKSQLAIWISKMSSFKMAVSVQVKICFSPREFCWQIWMILMSLCMFQSCWNHVLQFCSLQSSHFRNHLSPLLPQLWMTFCAFRPVLTFFLFIARALISGAFQAAYVYTPEVILETVTHTYFQYFSIYRVIYCYCLIHKVYTAYSEQYT